MEPSLEGWRAMGVLAKGNSPGLTLSEDLADGQPLGAVSVAESTALVVPVVAQDVSRRRWWQRWSSIAATTGLVFAAAGVVVVRLGDREADADEHGRRQLQTELGATAIEAEAILVSIESKTADVTGGRERHELRNRLREVHGVSTAEADATVVSVDSAAFGRDFGGSP